MRRSTDTEDQPTGGIGFFECIDDQQAAFLLFDTAKTWLKSQNIHAMDGPINFGEKDSYWGLLVDGFTHPSYEVSYNHKYYQQLFESYGFKIYYKQEGFHLDVTKPLPDRFLRIAAWGSLFENFEPLKVDYIRNTIEKAKPIIEEEFVWLGYKDGQPIAIYLMYPDLNEILMRMNGKLNLWNKLKFVYLKKMKVVSRARGVLMGVIPEFQNLGIESAFIMKIAKVMESKPQYREIEFSWVGDFNPRMRKIFISVGCESVKHYITYRYLFDRNAAFKRYPIPDEK